VLGNHVETATHLIRRLTSDETQSILHSGCHRALCD
jgi:hypothetical protein